MKEQKFRAWDKRTNNWFKTELPFYGFHLFGECTMVCGPSVSDIEHLVVTETIGRTDVNKKDIYRSDIIEFYTREKIKQVGIVKYAACSYFIDCGQIMYYSWIDYSMIKILGSTFRNPELLK